MNKASSEEGAVVLVTGASGYVATNLVQQLQQQGYQVRGTVRSLTNEEKVKPLRNLCPDARYPVELVEADLVSEAGWVEVVKGCTYVFHTASPFYMDVKDEQEVIKPAVDGTLNVLRACQKAGGVKRVVLTSSCAAIEGKGTNPSGKLFTEDNWTDVNDPPSSYHKSKTLAERAAWDFVKNLPVEQKFELAVINPCFVMGPALCGTPGYSMQMIMGMMLKMMPTIPKYKMPIIDVRDVAKAHIAAMTSSDAVGHRHITAGEMTTSAEIAQVLVAEFGPQGYDVLTEVEEGPSKGLNQGLDNSRLRNVLGINPIPWKKSLIDMAYSMIESGHIKKMDGYKGPSAK